MSTQPGGDGGTSEPSNENQPSEPSTPKPTETVEFWREKAREQEKRAKANADAAKRLSEIEESQKSEAQKAAEALAAANQARAEAEAKALALDIATEFRLGKEDASLVSKLGDETDMRALAQRLATQVDQQQKKGNRVPNEGKPAGGSKDDAMREFARGLFKRTD